MTLVELQRTLRQLRCSGMAVGLEGRLLQAQAEPLAPIDFLSTLVQDELLRRQDRLLERRLKHAGFRDAGKTLDTFDFDFNKKMNRALVFELATGRFITQREDGLFLGRPGTGKSHLAQAIGVAVIQQGHRVLYREAHTLLDELADAQLDGTRKAYLGHVYGDQRRRAGRVSGRRCMIREISVGPARLLEKVSHADRAGATVRATRSFLEEKLEPIGARPGYSIASLFLPWHPIPAPFFDGFRSLPAT